MNGQTYSTKIFAGGVTCCLTTVTGGSGILSVNEDICVQGALTGQACGIVQKVNGVNSNVCVPAGCFNVTNMARAGNNGDNLAGQGDSGAPLTVHTTLDGRDVAGIVSDGVAGTETTCTGQPVTRTCFSRILFAPWTDFRTAFSPSLSLN